MIVKHQNKQTARLRYASRRDLERQDDEGLLKHRKSAKEHPGHTLALWYMGIILFPVFRLTYRYVLGPRTFISCEDDQPLVHIQHDFLSADEYHTLRQCTLQHHKLHVESSLNNGAFSQTKGFVVKF